MNCINQPNVAQCSRLIVVLDKMLDEMSDMLVANETVVEWIPTAATCPLFLDFMRIFLFINASN